MHPEETRHRAVIHYKYFLKSIRKAAGIYSVPKSTMHRWINKNPTIRKRRKTRTIRADAMQCINTTLAADPFSTMNSISRCLKERCNMTRSRYTVSRFARRIGWRRKKAFRTVDCTHDPNDLRQFCTSYKAVAGDDLICIDEAGFHVGDHKRYGYCRKGERLNIAASRTVRREKLTLVMAISRSGVVAYTILNHNCRKADFIQFIKNVKVKRLLMDNIPFHHSVETLEAVKSKGCKALFIPKYSPRFNAIEYFFSTLKQQFRAECWYHEKNMPDCLDLVAQVIACSDARLDRYFNHVDKSVDEMVRLNFENISGYDR